MFWVVLEEHFSLAIPGLEIAKLEGIELAAVEPGAF